MGKMEHNRTDSSALATQGPLSESVRDERGNQEIPFLFPAKEHSVCFCAVVLMATDI